jgi:hypothetical protein
MAVTSVTTTMAGAINYTVVTDTSADWGSVSNSTYFYDKADKLVHYKDSTGVVQNIYKPLPSAQSVVSSATVTPTATSNQVVITAQNEALFLANPTETWVQGQSLIIRIKDDNTPRAISFDTKYRAIGVTLPTTTTANKIIYLGIIYNSTDDKWDVIGISTQV